MLLLKHAHTIHTSQKHLNNNINIDTVGEKSCIIGYYNRNSFPAGKIAKSNTWGGSLCRIGIQYAMPYS